VSLRELLDDAAAIVPDVLASSTPDGTMTWSRADKAFAALSADGVTAEFALDPPVAAAAVRTPDASPSPRGPGWVRFEPARLDDHAADRAVAWFASAHRRLPRG
jgi:hypothetical protein